MGGNRRSIRLKDYDYSQTGAYFITICAQDRLCLFGDVENENMILNDAGQSINRWYFELQNKFETVHCVEHVIMPNHMHAIIQNTDNKTNNDDEKGAHAGAPLRRNDETIDKYKTIVGADLCVCPDDEYVCPDDAGSPLHRVVQWFKTMTTNEYIRGVKQYDWPLFPGRLWQRNYYERIIRNDDELVSIRDYINTNPARWEFDRLNPSTTKPDREEQ